MRREKKRGKRLIAGMLCMVLLFSNFMSGGYVTKAAEIENEQPAVDEEQNENISVDEGEMDSSGGDGTTQDDSQEEDTGTEDNVENPEGSGENKGETESGNDMANDEDSAERNDGTSGDDEEGNDSSEIEGGEDASDETDVEAGNEEEISQDETLFLNVEERLASMSAEGDIASGIYSDVAWVIDATGKLTVKGTGNYSSNGAIPGWYKYKESILYAEINLKNAEYATNLFFNCNNLVSVDLRNFDTGNVINMIRMFCGCESLTNLDLSGINTSKVTKMAYMFDGCANLISLDLRRFNTENVTDMENMFNGCANLKSLDISGFNTNNVTNMTNMFSGCESLKDLNIDGLDTGKVTNLTNMFYGCKSLTSLDVGMFDTRNVTDMSRMFNGCENLINLDLSGFDTRNVTTMGWMFTGCKGLVDLNVSGFNTSNVTDMGEMFSGCENLEKLDLKGFTGNNIGGMYGMFRDCRSLVNLQLGEFNTKDDSHNNMAWMFSGCERLESVDLSGIDANNVMTMLDMFNDCYMLNTIYTPYNISISSDVVASLPSIPGDTWYRSDGTTVTELPQNLSYSVALGKNYIPEEKVPEIPENSDPVIPVEKEECTIFVYDTSTKEPIENAELTIDGTAYCTMEDGLVRLAAANVDVKKKIVIKAEGYDDVTTYQYIMNGLVIRIGLKLYTGSLQITDASVSLKNVDYDLLREKLVLGYAKDFNDFTNVTKDTLELTVKSNKDNVSYEIFTYKDHLPGSWIGTIVGSDEVILLTSLDGRFSLDVVTEAVKVGNKEIASTAVTDLVEPGKRLLLRATDENGNKVVKLLNLSTTHNYVTQENISQQGSFKLGSKININVPEDIPFIGGSEFNFGFDDDMPFDMKIEEDGKIKISYNRPANIDMDKFGREYKNLEKKVEHKIENIAGSTHFGAGMIDVSGKVCGYGEGNINEIMNGDPDIKLGIMVEIGASAGYKHYWIIGFVPVKLFVEGSVTGSAAMEAEIKFENWKIKGFDYSGGSFNVTLELGVGGGIGFGYEVEASLVGSINYANKPAREYEKIWLEASGRVKRVLVGVWEKIFWESDKYQYTLYQKGSDTSRPYTMDSLSESTEFTLTGRNYLNYTEGYRIFANSMGITAEDAGDEGGISVVKTAVFPGASPTMVGTDQGRYLFWIDDNASRNACNRTALMYSKTTDGVNWSTPKQLLAESEDNTLDASFDVFLNGNQIYLVWQDAARPLTEEEGILDAVRLMSVRYAVLDIDKDQVTESERLTENEGYYMYPCTVAAGDESYFAYVHNTLDTGDIDGNNTQHLYVVMPDRTTREVNIPDSAQIVNMDAGIFAGKTSLVCEIDMDGNASTEEDREIYVYDFQTDNLARVTDNGTIDTMPFIADSGRIYWFHDTEIVRLSETGQTAEAIWNEQQIAYQTAFSVATDASGNDNIFWESVDKNAEDGSVAIYCSRENGDGTWGNAVKFAGTTGTISSKISAAGSDEGVQVAYTDGVYLADGTALKDLCVTGGKEIADIAVTYVDFDEENAAAGNPLILRTGIVNHGNTVVNEVVVSVNDAEITTLNGLNLKPGESREVDVSGFVIPASLRASTYFTLRMTASGENGQEDNTVEFLLGCPDVYVETANRVEQERTFLDVSIWNNTDYAASGEVLVHKGSENGEVIYRKSYSELGSSSGYAYSFDIGDYEWEHVKYYVEITTDDEENCRGNNTEFVYTGYGTGIEEKDENQGTQEINAITLNNNGLVLGIGDTSQLIAQDDQGTIVYPGRLLWTSGDKRIASVDQTGLVKAHRAGKTEITAYYGELSYSCTVIVGEESGTQTLTVWFDSQGGDIIEPVTGIVPGSSITLPTNVRMEGYVFDGWYTQPVNGEKIDSPTLVVERSMTLYAHWISAESETGLWVGSIADQVYTGKAIKPQVKVYDGTKLLKEKTDYTVSYRNNINANDATNEKKAPTITVTGKGNYSGKEVVTFRILPVDLNGENIIVEDITVAYNNKIQKKLPTLAYNGKKLSNKKDFTVSYPEEGADAYKAPDTYNITVVAKNGGNFTGTRTVKLTITNSRLISKATVKKIMPQEYTGSAVEPAFSVTYGKVTLSEGTDYTAAFSNNVEVGTATVILSGIGDYAGTKKVAFKINGISLKKAEVYALQDKTYDGSEQKQNVSVGLNHTILEEGKDYEVSYANNINAGTASIIITGKGAYTGNVRKTFKIFQYPIMYNMGLEGEITAKYVKGGSRPEVNLVYAGRQLIEGKDYTISYRNNKAVTTAETKKKPVIIIKGKGNFKGTQEKEFTIENKALNDADSPVTLMVPDKAFVNKAGKYTSKPVLTDADGKKLAAGKDYERVIVYSLEDGTELNSKSKVNVGTHIKVKVTGKGAYTGELDGIYRITACDFTKAKIRISPQIYSGQAITLNQGDLTVKVGKDILTFGTDYEIVEGSYTNNVKKGTASVTIVGQGSYGGRKTVKFKITSKKLMWFWRLFG